MQYALIFFDLQLILAQMPWTGEGQSRGEKGPFTLGAVATGHDPTRLMLVAHHGAPAGFSQR
jgi:hypothetical protein